MAAAPPLALLDIDLHFAAFAVPAGASLRLALSCSYFPMFLATGGHGPVDVADVQLDLPRLGGEPATLHPPDLAAAVRSVQTVQRLRAPRQAREPLEDDPGVRVRLDDGTALTIDGLAVSSSGEIVVRSQPRGRLLQASATFASTLTKDDEHARVEVATTLRAAHGDQRAATIATCITATANGEVIFTKRFSDDVAL